MKKRKKFRPLKCINGVRGAIALVMAVLMTPFLTILMMLVEVGRYNSAVSILDEALGVSSVSMMAEYDEYLKDRWGLLAVSQGTDVDSLFSNTLETNVGVLGNSITLNSSNVTGMYSLGDAEVLQDQILEYSKLNAPTYLASNFLNVTDLIQKLEEFGNLQHILNLATAGVSTIDSKITIAESTKELKRLSGEIESANTTYVNAYSSFETAANNLIDALAEPWPSDAVEDITTLTEEELAELEKADAEHEKKLDDLRSKANSAKTAYKNAVVELKSQLKEYKDTMSGCKEGMSTIQSAALEAAPAVLELKSACSNKRTELETAEKALDDLKEKGVDEASEAYIEALKKKMTLEQEVVDLDMQLSMQEAISEGVTTSVEGFDDASAGYDDATMGERISSLDSLVVTLNQMDMDTVTSSTSKIGQTGYYVSGANYYVSASELDAFLASEKEDLAMGSLSTVVDGIENFLNTVLKTKGVIDPELAAYIDTEYYESIGGLPGAGSADGPLLEAIRSLGNIVKSTGEIGGNIATLDLIGAYNSLKTLLTSVKTLIESIAEVGTDLVKNLYDLVTSYERLYYATYATFNLPCRTDHISGELDFDSMSGYSVDLPSKDGIGAGTFANLAAMVDAISSYASGTGDDLVFSGAALEYILFGSNSEVANQLYTFSVLYFVRLLINIPSVIADKEIKAIATALPKIISLVVLVLFMVVEPLADMVLLVNDGEVAFVKSDLYLSPSGLPGFIEELTICKFTEAEKASIESGFNNAFSVTSGSSGGSTGSSGVNEDNSEEENKITVDISKDAESGDKVNVDLSKDSENENKVNVDISKEEDKIKVDLEKKPENESEDDKDPNKEKPPTDDDSNKDPNKEKTPTDKDDDTEKDKDKNDDDSKDGKNKKGTPQFIEDLYTFNYREYCFILMLITVEEEELLARLQNYIQMESLYHYQEEKAPYVFKLQDSYTYFEVEANVTVNQMLPSLADSSYFTVDRKVYRGY